MKLSYALTLSALIGTCNPSPSPIPAVDAGDAYANACANLKRLNCPEGLADDCAATMRNADNQINNMNPGCVAACNSQSCVQACTPAILCK